MAKRPKYKSKPKHNQQADKDDPMYREMKFEVLRVYWRGHGRNILNCRIIESNTGKGIGQTIIVKGPHESIIENQVYKSTGMLRKDLKKNSYFLSADKIIETGDMTKSGMIEFLQREGPNVGEVRARQLVDAFGSNIIKILAEEPERVLVAIDKPKLTEERLLDLSQWADSQLKVAPFKEELYGIGLKPSQVAKVINFFGSDVVNKVKSNCFRLTEADGLGFKTVSKIADMIGISDQDPERIKAAIVYCVNQELDNVGGTCINDIDLVRSVNKLTHQPQRRIATYIGELIRDGKLIKMK